MNDNQQNDPLKFAVSVKTAAEYMRLPPSGAYDPIFGLKRSFLNLLILPSAENEWRPPVKSIVLRRKRRKKGVRLIEIASLRAYIAEQAQATAPEVPAATPSAGGSGCPC
jgi:hypothetical protein